MPTPTNWAASAQGGILGMEYTVNLSSNNNANVHDENISTYSQIVTSGATGSGYVAWNITLPYVVTLTYMYIRFYGNDDGFGIQPILNYDYFDTTWRTVHSAWCNETVQTWEETFSGNELPGVSKVRGKISGVGKIGANQPWGRMYEIRAEGYRYQDKGLRVRVGASTQSLACETLDDHKLRIRKDSTTWGIPLVNTNHKQASPLRIYDGLSVKAFVKL